MLAYNLKVEGSSHGLVDNGAELVIKFRVQIPQRSVLVLEREFNFKTFLCYARRLCSVASIVGYPSDTPKEKAISSSSRNKVEVKLVREKFLFS